MKNLCQEMFFSLRRQVHREMALASYVQDGSKGVMGVYGLDKPANSFTWVLAGWKIHNRATMNYGRPIMVRSLYSDIFLDIFKGCLANPFDLHYFLFGIKRVFIPVGNDPLGQSLSDSVKLNQDFYRVGIDVDFSIVRSLEGRGANENSKE